MIYYTNAPKDYDYWFVKEVDPDVGRLTSGIDTERPVRKIDLSEAGEWQVQMMQDRYLSGLYPMIPQHQWEEWLEAGFAVANEDEEDESDYSRGMDPDSWCADDAIKGE